MAIYYYSGPVRSGKTSRLSEWVKHHTEAGGILTPDVGDKRMILNINTNEYIAFECSDHEELEKIQVGRFHFLTSSFRKGNEIISDSFHKRTWTILDEWGKLEMEGRGFMPEINNILNQAVRTEDRHVLVVVRDYLLESFLLRFPESEPMVFLS